MKAVIQVIREADRGQLLTDMEQGLTDICNEIEKRGGAGGGEITIKIKVGCKSEGAYDFKTSLKVTISEPPRLPMIMFRDEDSGELSRKDPRQPDLPVVVDADFKNGRGRVQKEEQE